MEGDPQLTEAARGNRILSAFPDGDLGDILDGSTLANLQYGRRVYRQDGPVDSVYFPIQGVVSILVGSHDEEVEMATVGNEGMVGITAALDVPRALGRALVQVGGTAIRMTARRFQELRAQDDRFGRITHRYLYAFMRQIAQAGACNRLHTAEERCARWLLMTADRACTEEFCLTQDFLAEMMGTRRASVNLALAVFRRAGAIQYVYRRIKLVDRKQLESFSCPCYEIIRQAYEVVTL
jgi:CRP-like cAMP-binding protein